MARLEKDGADYFPLDCKMDDNFELIEAEYGLAGFAIIIKLWQSIYFQNYYTAWSRDNMLLFARKHKIDNQLVEDVVSAALRRGIFSLDLYEKYGILTSRGIQKRRLQIITRRKKVQMCAEFLLVERSRIPDNVDIYSINADINLKDADIIEAEPDKCIHDADINSINDGRSTQSKVKESKVKNKKNICTSGGADETEEFFESVWALYPKKKGKAHVSKKTKKELRRLGYEAVKGCIERYAREKEAERTDLQYYQYGSTFFNGGYKDYLDQEVLPAAGTGMEIEDGEDRFACLEPDVRKKLELLGIIEGQSLNYRNMDQETLDMLNRKGLT